MSKTLSAKYYQENKERPQKRPMKDIKIFLKKKRGNMVVNVTKISEDEKQKLIEYRKKYKMRKKWLLKNFETICRNR